MTPPAKSTASSSASNSALVPPAGPNEVVNAMGLDDFARTLRHDRLYFSGQPDDDAVFARYPVIEQAAIGPR